MLTFDVITIINTNTGLQANELGNQSEIYDYMWEHVVPKST